MRNKLLLPALILLMVSGAVYAQSPKAFNYQAVARDASGDVIQNQAVGIRLSLHKSSAAGIIVYSETHLPTTNDFGLFTLSIGTGAVVSGDFDTIGWGSNQYWLQVEMDPAGGTTYTDMGTSQLLSVPYAMFAANAGSSPGPGTSGQTLRHNGTGWVPSSLLFNNGSKIGIGTTNPTNELQIESSGGSTSIGLINYGTFSNYGSTAELSFARGTQGVPSAVLNGDALGWINFKGYDGSDFQTCGWLMARASEDWSATATGNDLFIINTPNGTSNQICRIAILNDGKVGINTFSPTTQLHVSGGARITGALYDGTNSAGSSGNVLTSTGSSTQWVNNSIGFAVYRSASDVTVPAATYTTIVFNSEHYDDGNGYSTSTGSYTAPSAGVYHFDACIRLNGTATDEQVTVVGLFVNGIQQRHKRMPSDIASFSIDISADLKLLSGDVVTVQVYCQTATGASFTNNYSTYFTGHKVY